MKKAVVLFCAVFCIFTVATINQGCAGNPAAATAVPTATPMSVTFTITDNGQSSHCGGSAVPWDVAGITLKHSISGVETTKTCTVPSGYTRSIVVTIPANDTYNVFINTEVYCCNPGSGCDWDSAIFNNTPLVSGSTYIVSLGGGSASTLDSTASSGIF